MSLKYFRILLTSAVIIVGFNSTFCQTILGIEGEKHSSIGIYIKDIKADTMVVSHNVSQCMMPASIMKIYTSASALSLLDSDFRFETKVYLTGSASAGGGVWNGNLIVKASGDPTLESEYFKSTSGFLKEILNALTAKGINRLNGDILLERVDPTHQYQEGPVDTWNINDVGWAYGCGVFDFNWCDNYFGIYPATGKTSIPVPGLEYKVWDNPWGTGLNMIRGIYSDSLIITGKKYMTDRRARVNTSMPNPFAVFKAMLTERLAANGITVSGKKANQSNQRVLLVNHKSVKLDDILKSLMLRSDNMFAEAILRLFGTKYGNRAASIDAENKLWSDRGICTDYIRVLDGSGLSRTNAVSPEFFGVVLEWMAKSPLKNRFMNLFPVSGLSGTMKSFLAEPEFKGRFLLKTGSVNAVQTYAGYMVDNNGEPSHVIVFMANNFFCSRAELRTALMELLTQHLFDNHE